MSDVCTEPAMLASLVALQVKLPVLSTVSMGKVDVNRPLLSNHLYLANKNNNSKPMKSTVLESFRPVKKAFMFLNLSGFGV